MSGAYAFRRVRRAKDSGSEGEPPCETGGKRRELRRAENGYRFLDECAPPRLFLWLLLLQEARYFCVRARWIRKFQRSLLVTFAPSRWDLLSNHDTPNSSKHPLPSSSHWSPSTRYSRFSIEPVNSRRGGLNSLTAPRTLLRPDDEFSRMKF